MSQLTGGKYTRIWTPLAHDILFVDTADGQPLSVQVLSRGTREQLFVSLRLALVAAYARRGIHLPMILDDVFVNFDAGRTQTACAVLRDFAKQGHQLLVFTCHEHVWRMFQELKVDTRRIPNRFGEVETVEETIAPLALPEPAPVITVPPVAEKPIPAAVISALNCRRPPKNPCSNSSTSRPMHPNRVSLRWNTGGMRPHRISRELPTGAIARRMVVCQSR